MIFQVIIFALISITSRGVYNTKLIIRSSFSISSRRFIHKTVLKTVNIRNDYLPKISYKHTPINIIHLLSNMLQHLTLWVSSR